MILGSFMLSIIIPIYNEEKVIADTLLNLTQQTVQDFEVIAVDGGSDDLSCEIVDRFENVKLLHAHKGRAKQMNFGAAVAKGEWLLFLHADTLLPNNAVEKINALHANAKIKSGGFRHCFSGDNWRLKLISYLDNYRCNRTRIIYGDQAMFVQRELFELIGGFPDMEILEDIYFSIDLKKHTQPILLDDYAVTDSRKFISMGIWRSLFRVAMIQLRVRLGLTVAKDYPFFTDAR